MTKSLVNNIWRDIALGLLTVLTATAAWYGNVFHSKIVEHETISTEVNITLSEIKGQISVIRSEQSKDNFINKERNDRIQRDINEIKQMLR